MDNTIFAGSFAAESYWKPSHYASLPHVRDDNAENIVLCMDELLFGFLNRGDELFTFKKFNTFLKDYLVSIGYTFSDSYITGEILNDDILSELVVNNPDKCNNKILGYYAITSNLVYNIFDQQFPLYSAIINVNSKVYSTNYNKENMKTYSGYVINTIDDLDKFAVNFDDPFIIKDPFGVSGQGSLQIDNKRKFILIRHYLQKQESNGKFISFVVEPFLTKKLDFSSHYFISDSGKFSYLSTQIMLNNGLAYTGSYSIDDITLDKLIKSDYFRYVEDLLRQIFKDGYFGYVCVDSMITASNEIIPVIEINARRSMGLLNYYYNRFLNSRGVNCMLSFFILGIKDFVNESWIFDSLQNNNLLYTNDKECGIMPISMNTVLCNKNRPHKDYSIGRFYFVSTGKNLDIQISQIEQMKVMFLKEGIRI
jgi:hypothetical protein